MAKGYRERGEPSMIEDHGPYANTCGYCKSDGKTSVSYGLWAHSLSVYDYQELLDRGWRRSGMFLYKPEMAKTCCPAYTIRLKADSFCPSKEQTRVMHRLQRYIDGTYDGPASTLREDSEVPCRPASSHIEVNESDRFQEVDECPMDCEGFGKPIDTDNIEKTLSCDVEGAIKACTLSGQYPADLEVPKIALQRVKPSMRKRIKSSLGELVYTCNIAFLCAAALLKHRDLYKFSRAFEQGDVSFERQKKEDLPVVLAELLASNLQNKSKVHGFEVEACKGHLNFVLRNHAGLDLDEMVDSPPSKCSSGNVEIAISSSIKNVSVLPCLSRRTQPPRTLEIRIKRSAFDPEEFALYKRYQIAVHNDKPEDVKESSFVRFLVNSPLTFVPPSKPGTMFCGFGSFHQQYWIDGHLVAVGVVDILPSCLSSKYLFWDPDLAFLSLGKYSALQEIQWVQKAHTECPSLEYYYLGYYIHTCPKMRYKGAYRPSELLCPVKFQWVPFDIAQRLLDIQPFVCLSDWLNTTKAQKYAKDSHIKHVEANNEVIGIGESSRLDGSQNCEVDGSQNGGAASSSKESEDVSNVLLKLGSRFLQFKHLQAWTSAPQKFIDALVCDLRKYAQVVGPALAMKMAYVLG